VCLDWFTVEEKVVMNTDHVLLVLGWRSTPKKHSIWLSVNVHFSDWADDYSESAGDSSESAGDDEKDHKPGIPSGACKIISKVCSPMGCV